MIELPVILLIVLCTATLAVVIWMTFRQDRGDKFVRELDLLKNDVRHLESLIRSEMSQSRTELAGSLRQNREELAKSLGANEKRFNEFITSSAERSDAFTTSVNSRFEHIRESMTESLGKLQENNAKKLDEMRKVVDEKLQESVEKRFNDSFKLISERLEAVHKGLGEMQLIASGVGDLKRVLTNVKTRGGIGEVQLGAILEQYLAPDQYVVTAQVRKNTSERVEFAVRMPGKKGDENPVLLPVDSKFPTEDYQRLLLAYDKADSEEISSCGKALESAIKRFAADIRNKYINPPVTTDFALMFVPSEGLYAEVLRRPGLFELLQRDYRVTVVGPANLVAFLNSLQMGFRTLAIEKRSSEVWAILGAVKTEFGKFSDVLEKMRGKLDLAVKEIDNAGRRSRAIERKLRTVEELPGSEAEALLALSDESGDDGGVSASQP